ncbi:unnamed protein product [Symbiodinium sp. CCMP2592]|nr:unnamed protein product [Symbiodinium sp. CCMP2592]
MPTPLLRGREPPVDKVARDPRTSTTSDSDFYTTFCRMYEHFTPTTSEVPSVWDAGSDFMFHPPPPPPPPPRHRRSSTLWDVSAAVPKERTENGCEVHWSNPYGPDPPADPVVEDSFQKADKLSSFSSSWREEGLADAPKEASEMSDPCSSIPPVEEPAFAALANLRVSAEMPGDMPASFSLSEYYSMQGPLSPCSPAPTECHGGRMVFSLQELTEYDGRHGLLSPAATEYPFERQASFASTQVGPRWTEYNEGQGLAGGFSPKFPAGSPVKPDDLLHEDYDFPLGMPHPDDSTAHQPCQKEVSENCLDNCSSQWCGLFSWHESAPEACSRCKQALGSFWDHRCPKCSNAVCVNCVAKLDGQPFRCNCGEEPRIDSTLWMMGAYNFVVNAFEFITSTKPAGASEGYTAMPSRSQANFVPNPLLELRPAASTTLPQHRTFCPASSKEMPPANALPPQQPLPSLLSHRRRVSQVADVFKTHLPGEMPCSPMPWSPLQPALAALTTRCEVWGTAFGVAASAYLLVFDEGLAFILWVSLVRLRAAWMRSFQPFLPTTRAVLTLRGHPEQLQVDFTVNPESTAAQAGAHGREPTGFSHRVRDGHGKSAFVPRDPGSSTSTTERDVEYPGRAGSFYTAFCRMYEHFTPTTSEVPSVWDAGSDFMFHPPPPPPPPPRHRRSSTLWDVSAAVPKERTENGCEVHWSNPYGPDPPTELAPPAAKQVIEDSFQKADKLSSFSTSWREEGLADAPKEASEMSDPCSSIPPVEEPAFAALANLRVSAEMPGDMPASFCLSEYYSMQGPLSPCSPAPTECYHASENPFLPARAECSYNRLNLQAPWSPVPTEYPCPRQTSWSPASTTCDYRAFDAPLPEYNGGQGLAGGFSPKFPAGSPVKPDDLLHEDYDFPFGMPPTDVSENCLDNCSSQWCGLFSCHEPAPESCSRCKQALGSFFDHHCPKCSNAVCVSCIAKFNGQPLRCNCGDAPKIDSTLWMIGAYNSVMSAFDFVASPKPAGASEGYTAMPSRSEVLSVPNPLLELPPAPAASAALTQHRTFCPASTKEMLPATALPPPPQPMPLLLGHRRRASHVADVFKTHLPGEMPCSPALVPLQPALTALTRRCEAHDNSEAEALKAMELHGGAFEGSLARFFHCLLNMPTPSLSGREPIGFCHKAQDGHGDSAFVPRDPGSSTSTTERDVEHPGRAGSFYTAFCRMYEHFTPTTSEVPAVWDAGSDFMFHPPPPPPPPPRHRRCSSPLWDISATVPKERPENGFEVHWPNPYGPDPPADPVFEDSFQKADKLSTFSSSWREEGLVDAPKEASEMSDPCSSIPPVEEPAFAALANLRVSAEMPGDMPASFSLSEYYSMQGPLSPCSHAPTECYHASENPFPPARAECSYNRLNLQAPWSPVPTEYPCPRQTSWSPASTTCDYRAFDAPLPEYNGGQRLAGGFSPKFPAGSPVKPDDLLHEDYDFPFGMPPTDVSESCLDNCSSQWCGLFSCHEPAPESCSRCKQALGSFFDHHCPKCSNAVCVSCIAKLNGQPLRCNCGDAPKIDSTLWMIGAYNSVMSAFDFVTSAKPAGASEGYTAMPSRSEVLSVPNPLLELPPAPAASAALTQHRTFCPASTKEMLPATALPPPPQPMPLLLGHRRRASHVADVFKTHLPGEMPCSPALNAMEPKCWSHRRLWDVGDRSLRCGMPAPNSSFTRRLLLPLRRGTDVQWSNPYGPDPPADPVFEDSFQKADKLSAFSSSWREEGPADAPKEASEMSDPCSSIPPVEEPAFAALANLRVSAEMPGDMPASFSLSEYYSMQGPLSPCSPAPTESYGGRVASHSQELTEYDGRHGLLSPAATEYPFERQASFASTQVGPRWTEYNEGQGLDYDDVVLMQKIVRLDWRSSWKLASTAFCIAFTVKFEHAYPVAEWSGTNRAGSFYTAFCRMYEHFTPTTSEVPSVWDAGSDFMFHPPPPPPPPPRHRRSSTLWDVSAAVPKKRTENGYEVHWSNPYGPDPPTELAPPAAKQVVEDSFQEADKLSSFPSSFREEGLADAPKEASEMSDPCSSIPPVEEPAFAALANLRVSAEMPGDMPASFSLSEYYSMQGPLSPCSPAHTECYHASENPFPPARAECSYNRLNLQAPWSPVPTEYPCPRQTSWSPASTTCEYRAFDAPLPEYNGGQGLAGGFSPKFPAGSPVKPDDPLHEDYDFPFGVPPTDDVSENCLDNCSSQWCGLFSCHEPAPESCSRCKQALGSFFDHHCPKCSNAVCVSCIAKLNGQPLRCKCGDAPKIDSTLWMIGAYNSVMSAFDFVTSPKPAGVCEGYTAMPSRSEVLSVPNPLLELPPASAASAALTQHRTFCPASTKEMLPVADVFKTHLPGEMPCSPTALIPLQPALTALTRRCEAHDNSEAEEAQHVFFSCLRGDFEDAYPVAWWSGTNWSRLANLRVSAEMSLVAVLPCTNRMLWRQSGILFAKENVDFTVNPESTAAQAGAHGREPTGFSHRVRDGHGKSAFVPRDPGSSTSTTERDVEYPGRAGSFYTAFCRMYEHFTPTTSEVPSVWDAGSDFMFHPPPPPPPPPRHRRSSTLWDVSAAVPKERTENGCEVHWSNPYGPDPPTELAPPAAKQVIEDSFQKADKLSSFSTSWREEGLADAPKEASEMSDPCSSIPPVEEPAFAALANLRVSAEMPGDMPASFCLSEYYSMQGPLSPCSPAPTECYHASENPFLPARAECSYNRLNLQAPWSPVPTEYPCPRQTSWSPASTTCDYRAFDAPLPEYNGGQGLAGGFSPKFPAGSPVKPDDLLHEDYDFPFGMPPTDVSENCLDNCSSQWCGLFSCHEPAPESCSRCKQALGSFFDHHCPKCSNAVCVSCIAKLNGQPLRCNCGDAPKIDSTLWMIGAYNSVMSAFDFVASPKPAGASEGYTAMPSRSEVLSVPNPLLELPPAPAASAALTQHRTFCPASTKEMLPATALPPPPQPMPLLLGHRRRASHVADVFKTHLPGEMPCSPALVPLQPALTALTRRCEAHDNSEAEALKAMELHGGAFEGSLARFFHCLLNMPTPSLSGREPIGFCHKAQDGHGDSAFVPRDPGSSTSTTERDVEHPGRAGSFYTAFCRMYEHFTPTTSEVPAVWDAGSDFMFHPPPPPPPPPRHRRCSSPLWDISATVPKERPENGFEVHWSNPYGPDPPADPVFEDSFQKADKLSTFSSSWREEGLVDAPKEASEMSDPCSSIPPVEEPAFAALANLRVSAEMPGDMPASFSLSEYYSMQGPLSPCSHAPTECYHASENPFPPARAECSYNRLNLQAPWSPVPTEYPCPRQTSWSPASTTCDYRAFDAPLPEYNGGQRLAGGFSPKFPAGSPVKPDDLLHEDYDFPFGMPPTDVSESCLDNCSSQWCGLFSCHEPAPESCSRCKQALGSFFDHHCPKCSNAVCVSCIAKLNGQPLRCNCGDAPKIDSTLWMIGAYNSVMSAFDFVTSAKPAGASEGYTAMPSRSEVLSVPNPLLELPPAPAASAALTQHRTFCPASTKEMLPATALPPPPQPMPLLLGHRRRASHVADVFKTHLPGEMPCSPALNAMEPKCWSHRRLWDVGDMNFRS